MIRIFRTLLLLLVMTVVVSGCGSESSVSFGGSVGDGPVANARILLKNAAGELIAETISDSQAKYNFSVALKPSDFPLTIEAIGGIDLVSGKAPDVPLESIVLSPKDKRANINPHSTLIVKSAESMEGGLTPENVEKAKQVVVEKFSFGLDSEVVPDPITTPIDGENVAEIVKASEAMAEAVRRTAQSLKESGNAVDTHAVFEHLAADLADGVLDGKGKQDVDPRVTAVALTATAEVLLESMENRLEVDGKVATGALDNAIDTITPEAVKKTGDVRITAKMIDQANDAIAATEAVSGQNTRLPQLRKDLTALPGNQTTPELVKKRLPKGVKWLLKKARKQMAKADYRKLSKAIKAVAFSNTGGIKRPDKDTAAGNARSVELAQKKAEEKKRQAEAARKAAAEKARRGELARKAAIENAHRAELARKAAAEKARQAELARKAAEEKRRQAEIARKKAEKKRQLELARKAAAEKRRQEVLARKAAEEKKRQEALARKQAEEKKRQEALARKAAEEKRRQEELARKLAEANKSTKAPAKKTPNQPAAKSVTLVWVAPDSRTDGRSLSLSELDGYRIYCGKNRNVMRPVMDLNDSAATRYTFKSAPSGCSAFAVTAYDVKGRESGLSNLKWM